MWPPPALVFCRSRWRQRPRNQAISPPRFRGLNGRFWGLDRGCWGCGFCEISSDLTKGSTSILGIRWACLLAGPSMWRTLAARCHRLRQVFRIAPLLGLNQQALQILPTTLPRLFATGNRRKASVEIRKGFVHPVKAAGSIASAIPPEASDCSPKPYRTTRRCNAGGRSFLEVNDGRSIGSILPLDNAVTDGIYMPCAHRLHNEIHIIYSPNTTEIALLCGSNCVNFHK